MDCRPMYYYGSNYLLSQPKADAFLDNACFDWLNLFNRHNARTWFAFQFYQPDCNSNDCRNRYRRRRSLYQHLFQIRSSQRFRKYVSNRKSRYFNLSDNPRRVWFHCLIPLSRPEKHGLCGRHRHQRLYVCFNHRTSRYFPNNDR